MFSAKHWGVIGPCFFLVWRCASPRLVSPFSHCWALKPTNSISARSLKSTCGSSFIDSLPTSTLRKYSKTNCTVGTNPRFTPGKLTCSKARRIPVSSRNTKNSSNNPASLSSCISSMASPAYNSCATFASSLHATLQLSRSCTTLAASACVSLGSSLSMLLVPLLCSLFPQPSTFLSSPQPLYHNVRSPKKTVDQRHNKVVHYSGISATNPSGWSHRRKSDTG